MATPMAGDVMALASSVRTLNFSPIFVVAGLAEWSQQQARIFPSVAADVSTKVSWQSGQAIRQYLRPRRGCWDLSEERDGVILVVKVDNGCVDVDTIREVAAPQSKIVKADHGEVALRLVETFRGATEPFQPDLPLWPRPPPKTYPQT